MRDLVVLVADLDMQETMLGLLSRPQSLGIRQIVFTYKIASNRDNGCWNEAEKLLRGYTKDHQYALVLFDHAGSGQESTPPDELQTALEERLAKNGWDDRARVVVLQPELEIWVWSDSPRVAEVLKWRGSTTELTQWLVEKGYWQPDAPKPDQPKEALTEALNKPAKAPLFRQLAKQVSLNRCQDPAFLRLTAILQTWFPTS